MAKYDNPHIGIDVSKEIPEPKPMTPAEDEAKRGEKGLRGTPINSELVAAGMHRATDEQLSTLYKAPEVMKNEEIKASVEDQLRSRNLLREASDEDVTPIVRNGGVEYSAPQKTAFNPFSAIIGSASAAEPDFAAAAANLGKTTQAEPDFAAAAASLDINGAREALLATQGTDPDKAAEAKRLADAAGMPAIAVEGNEKEVKEKLDFDRAAALLDKSPATARFMSDPNNAKLASDSVPNLVNVEKEADKLKPMFTDGELFTRFLDTPRAVLGAIPDTIGQIAQGLGYTYGVASRAPGRALYGALEGAGFGDLAEALRTIELPWWAKPETILTRGGEQFRNAGDIVAPPKERQDFGTEVAQGLGQLGAQIAAYIWTGGIAGPMTLFAQGVTQQADDIKEHGAELGTAATDTALLLGGSATAVTEKYGIDRLLEKVPQVKSYLGKILAGASTEFVQEFSEQVLQNLAALALYDPDRNLMDGTLEQAEPAGVVGAIVGAVLPGKHAVARKKTADTLHKEIISSPLYGRAPEVAIQHAAAVFEDSGVNDVYVPADRLLDAAADSQRVSAIFADDKQLFERTQDQALLGGDVKISELHLATILGDEKAYESLGEHIRYGAEALTEAEAKDTTTKEFVKSEADRLESNRNTEANVAAAGIASATDTVSRDTISAKTSADIGIAEEQIGMQALFGTAREAGLTKDGYEAYLLKVAKAKDSVRVAQEKKTLRAEQAKLKQDYQDKFEVQLDSARESLRVSDPVYGAVGAAGGGMDRINLQSVYDAFDAAETRSRREGKKLAKQFLDKLPKFKGRSIVTVKGEEGIRADVLANRFGFDSAEEMIRQMTTAKPFEQAAFELAERYMREKHPNLVHNVGGVRDAIKELHQNDAVAQLLAYELNAIRQARKQGALKPAVIRAEAKKRFDKMTLQEIKPERFVQAERRAGIQAGKLIRKGDRDGAARAKFQQLMNHYFARMAYDAQEKIDSQRRELIKLGNPRRKQPNIDASYVDMIHEYTSRINLLPPMTDERREKLIEKAQKKAEKDGAIFVIPPLVVAADQKQSFTTLTVAEWRQFYEMIKNIETQGRNVKEIGKLGAQRDKDQVIDEMLEESARIEERSRVARQREQQNPGFLDRSVAHLAGIDAALRKVEFMLQRLGGKANSTWHQAIFQRIADAQTEQLDFMVKYVRPLVNDLQEVAKAGKRPLTENIRVPELGRTFTRGDLLMLALNVGNESNLEKVIDGSKSDNGNVPWTRQSIDAALQRLTPQEARWVQKAWDTFERAYPKVEAVYRAEHGIAPQKIEGREVEVGGETLKGGYFPMLYDSKRGIDNNKTTFETALDMIQNPYVQATVFSGMTEARTGYSAPVLLDLAKLPYSFQQLAHFITHYDAVRDVKRLIEDKRVSAEVEKKLGREYRIELSNWLDAVATSGMGTMDMTKFDEVAQYMRSSVTVAVMGFSYTTGVSQAFGITSSIGVLGRDASGKFNSRVGADWMQVGIEQYMRNPGKVKKQVFKLSGEMRHRLENTDREMAHAMDNMAKRANGLAGKLKSAYITWNRASLMMIGGIQLYSVDIPTWVAAFNRGVSENMSQDDAVKYADSVVRMSQGTGHEKDLSRLQRKKGLWRAVTMFASYTTLLYNLQLETASDAKKISNVPGAIARMGWLVFLPALLDAALRAEWPKEPDDPASWGKWFAGKAVGYAARAFPVAGNAVDSLIQGYDPELSAIEGLGKSTSQLIKRSFKDMDDGEVSMKTVEAFVRTMGLLFGFGGTYQVGRLLDAIDAGDDAAPYDLLIGHKDN